MKNKKEININMFKIYKINSVNELEYGLKMFERELELYGDNDNFDLSRKINRYKNTLSIIIKGKE
jgi:hypothetical protein